MCFSYVEMFKEYAMFVLCTALWYFLCVLPSSTTVCMVNAVATEHSAICSICALHCQCSSGVAACITNRDH